MTTQGIVTNRITQLLNVLFRNVSLTSPNTYVGLATGNPGMGATPANEVLTAGTNYSRVLVLPAIWEETDIGAPTDGRLIRNNYDITFPIASSTWGTVSHYFIIDAASGGTTIAAGPLLTPREVLTDDSVRFPTNDLRIILNPYDAP